MSQYPKTNKHLIEAGVLTAEEVDEHERLCKLTAIAMSSARLTVAEIAELAGLSEERVRQIAALAEHKVKVAIITDHPELLKEL